MNNERTEYLLKNFTDVLVRLKEALQNPGTGDLYIDGTIQRFEFVFELCWKTLQKFLQEEGIDCGTPRETLNKAYASQWIDDEEVWLGMLTDRNETSHTYNQTKASQIYSRIQGYVPYFEQTLQLLKKKP
ncbi:nucleotidyltransferase substrate binding protein [bacterium]|nr:nucleotidyltransferase substrate binding protein [bacterium]